MKRVVQVVALSGLMTLVAGWLAAAPAGAAAPQVTHTKVNVTLTGIDVCGFTVDSVVQGTDTFKVFFDRFGNVSIQDVSHVVSTLTNEANGKVVYVEQRGPGRFHPRRSGQPGRHHHLHRYPHRDAHADLHLAQQHPGEGRGVPLDA